ncbi:MAG: hypothetical protein KGL39_15525 [Patescibacteria group bacterium]|nr:hypothetical protein [Patescibacteria group bacterium]
MRVVAGNQLTLSFEPSVRQRFPTLRQCLQYVVLQDPRGIKAVAADCDLSESELSRRLTEKSDGNPRSCDVDDVLVAVMHSTRSLLPLQWLAAEFGQDDESRRAAAVTTVESLLPQLQIALAELKRPERGGRR